MPLISVIVPIYNVGNYLEKCLNSIINQTYKNLEIILIDDGSTDNSAIICDNFAETDKRIVVVHKKNNGVSEARNTGIRLSHGDFLSFIDADDWIDLNLYEKVIDIFSNHNIDVVRYNVLIEENGDAKEANSNIQHDGYVDNKLILEGLSNGNIKGWSVSYVFKRILLNSNLVFKKDIIFCEDLLFTTELHLRANKTYNVLGVFYHYVQNSNSVTLNPEKATKIINTDILIYSILKSIYERYEYFDNEIRENVSTMLFTDICYNMNKLYRINTFETMIHTLIDSIELEEILAHVKFKKLKRSYRVFFLLLKYKCFLGLIIFGTIKRIVMK